MSMQDYDYLVTQNVTDENLEQLLSGRGSLPDSLVYVQFAFLYLSAIQNDNDFFPRRPMVESSNFARRFSAASDVSEMEQSATRSRHVSTVEDSVVSNGAGTLQSPHNEHSAMREPQSPSRLAVPTGRTGGRLEPDSPTPVSSGHGGNDSDDENARHLGLPGHRSHVSLSRVRHERSKSKIERVLLAEREMKMESVLETDVEKTLDERERRHTFAGGKGLESVMATLANVKGADAAAAASSGGGLGSTAVMKSALHPMLPHSRSERTLDLRAGATGSAHGSSASVDNPVLRSILKSERTVSDGLAQTKSSNASDADAVAAVPVATAVVGGGSQELTMASVAQGVANGDGTVAAGAGGGLVVASSRSRQRKYPAPLQYAVQDAAQAGATQPEVSQKVAESPESNLRKPLAPRAQDAYVVDTEGVVDAAGVLHVPKGISKPNEMQLQFLEKVLRLLNELKSFAKTFSYATCLVHLVQGGLRDDICLGESGAWVEYELCLLLLQVAMTSSAVARRMLKAAGKRRQLMQLVCRWT